MPLSGGIPLGSQFRFTTNLSLDMREVVADLTARDALEAGIRFEGLTCYVISEQKFYALVGGITDDDWQEVGSGSGSGFGGKNYFVDPTVSDNLDAVSSYLELSAPAAAFFEGSGQGIIAAPNFESLGIPDGTECIIYGDIAFPSNATLKSKRLYVKNFAQFMGFSLTPGGSIIAFTDTNDKGNYTVRFYYADPTQTDHMQAYVDTVTPQAGEGSLQIAFFDDATSAVGEGFELQTTVFDREDYEKVKYIKVFADATNQDYTAGNMVFKVIDFTSGLQVPLADNWMIQKVKGGYLVPIYAPSTCTQVLVSVHMIADNAADNWDVYFGTWQLTVDQTVAGDRVIVEYAINTGSTTTANTTNSAATSLNGGPGSLAEAGTPIININSTTLGQTTRFLCQFSSPNLPGDEFEIETLINGSTAWNKVGSNQEIAELKYGGNTLPVYGLGGNPGGGADYEVRFGNSGRVQASAYGAVSAAWADVNATRWRVKRTRVAKTSFSSTELTALAPYARYYQQASQAGLATATTTIINFPDRTDDTQSNVTTGAAWKFTAKKKMKARVKAKVVIGATSSWTATEYMQMFLYKNGVQYSELDVYYAPSTSTQSPSLVGDDIVDLSPGDYIDIRIYHVSGASEATVGTGRSYIVVSEYVEPKVFAQAGPVQNIQETNITLRKAVTSMATTPSNFAQVQSLTVGRDDLGEWNATTHEFVPKESDKYSFSLFAEYLANATGIRGMAIYDVDTNFFYYYDTKPAVSGVTSFFSQTLNFDCVAERRYRLMYFQNSGAGLNLTIHNLSITRLRSKSHVLGQVQNKFQEKVLPASIATNTTVTAWGLSNLVVGNWYEVTGVAVMVMGASEADATVTFTHNGQTVYTVAQGVGASGVPFMTSGISFKFKAAATTMTVATTNFGTGSSLYGTNSKVGSYIQIEEIATPKVEGTFW